MRLKINGSAVDSVTLGSRAPEQLKVMLADASGKAATMNNAHRIQSDNPNFQVISYTATYYPKDGSAAKEVRSLSRLVRPEIQSWIAASEGTIVIKDISLLSSNGTTRVSAQPLIVAANE